MWLLLVAFHFVASARKNNYDSPSKLSPYSTRKKTGSGGGGIKLSHAWWWFILSDEFWSLPFFTPFPHFLPRKVILQFWANRNLCLLSFYPSFWLAAVCLFSTLVLSAKESYYKIVYNSLLSPVFPLHRTIDHAISTFNLPTEFNASGQEHILDESDKVKIKVDPMKMNLEEITTKQLEDIVDGWMKSIMKTFRDAKEKVMTDVELASH